MRKTRTPLDRACECHGPVKPGSTLWPAKSGHACRPCFAPQPGETVVAKGVKRASIETDLDFRMRRMGRAPVLTVDWQSACKPGLTQGV